MGVVMLQMSLANGPDSLREHPAVKELEGMNPESLHVLSEGGNAGEAVVIAHWDELEPAQRAASAVQSKDITSKQVLSES